jgi:6,7-dimethyl-8-ribityllumazine synthase
MTAHQKGITDTVTLPSLGGITQLSGKMDAAPFRFGIVVSRFNASLTGQLVQSAVDALHEHQAADENIRIVWVPGAYEIPVVLDRMASGGTYDALIALGLVIQGETQHAEVINLSMGNTLHRLALKHGLPIIHEVVAVYDMAQAQARCAAEKGSRGWYAAEAAVEMVNLMQQIEEP